MRHRGQRGTPIRNRTCIQRSRQAQIIAQLLRHRLANVLERFGFVRAARANNSGQNSLVAGIKRAAVEYPLRVAALRRVIEQCREAARNAHGWRVFQVDGVDRFVLEAGQHFVCGVQCIACGRRCASDGWGRRRKPRHRLRQDARVRCADEGESAPYARSGRLVRRGEPYPHAPPRSARPHQEAALKDRRAAAKFHWQRPWRRASRATRWRRFAPRRGRAACSVQLAQAAAKRVERPAVSACIRAANRSCCDRCRHSSEICSACEVNASVPTDPRVPDRARRVTPQPDAMAQAAVRLASGIHPDNAIRTDGARQRCRAQRSTARVMPPFRSTRPASSAARCRACANAQPTRVEGAGLDLRARRLLRAESPRLRAT